MSTPTTSRPHPSPATKKASAHHVSTPSGLGQPSPAPRSIPSPAAMRKEQAAKTPMNHPTTSSQGSKTLGNTPLVRTLSHTGNISSPSANMLSFGTPVGLGVDIGTPGQLNMPTPALGATMMPTMSDLGLSASGPKRNEDEERKAKVRRVLKSIGKPVGRVSEEGIARVSRRVGFANDIDAEKLTAEERERKVGNRSIIMAGNMLAFDVALRNHIPTDVSVEIGGKSAALRRQAEDAGNVLLRDLTPSGVPLDAKLHGFAQNLERLARIDRLSSARINVFEALSGLYTSMKRLFDHEKQASTGSDTDMVVTCTKSGKPVMNARGRLGLTLEYWRDGRVSRTVRETESAVDVNTSNAQQAGSDSEDWADINYSLQIEAERSLAGLYPALRVSESWLPDPLDLPADDSIPWEDPPPTYLATDSVDNDAAAMAVESDNQLPELRFIAKLDPPVIMPYQTAMNIFSTVGMPAPQVFQTQSSYHSLLLGSVHPAASATDTSKAAISSTQNVLNDREKEVGVQHTYRLHVAKPELGFKLEELPFAHPRQLVELLPTLRQWALTGSLLRNVFATRGSLRSAAQVACGNGRPTPSGEMDLSLEELLNYSEREDWSDDLPIEITLATTPTPTLVMTFPTSQGGHESIVVQIQTNGRLTVTEPGAQASRWNYGHTAEETRDLTREGPGKRAESLARGLERCGDLGVWIEWVRRGG